MKTRKRNGQFTRRVAGARWCALALSVLALLCTYSYGERKDMKLLVPVTDPSKAYAWTITPTPTPPPEQDVVSYIKAVFGRNAKVALAVAKGECRGLDTKCKNVSSREYSVCHFQVNIKAHFNKIPGKTLEDKEKWLADHRNCTLMAKVIFEESNSFRPWAAFLNGSYKQYLAGQ